MPPPVPPKIESDAEAVVVLGCRVHEGGPKGALRRRLEKAAQVCEGSPHLPVIMSGGKSWNGVQESHSMKQWWLDAQVSSGEVLVEEKSTTTRENAMQIAVLCKQLRYRHVVLVTCDFHMPRARHLFQKFQLRVTPAPAIAERSKFSFLRLMVREWGARAIEPWQNLLRKKESAPK